jgi:hypothetical protein
LELGDVANLRVRQLGRLSGEPDWYRAEGHDPLSPDAKDTSYWAVGASPDEAKESLRAFLEARRKERKRMGREEPRIW